jgi:hypothetical protein
MNNRIGDNLIHFGSNEALVRALTDVRAKFVVVGGLAIAWHCPDRQADDMDLLVEPTVENSALITRALGNLHLTGFSVTSFAKLGLQVPLKQTYYAELLTPQEGASSFSDIEARSIDARLFSIPVRLASVSTLLEMKKRAVASAEEQRDKHERDIELLEKHAG